MWIELARLWWLFVNDLSRKRSNISPKSQLSPYVKEAAQELTAKSELLAPGSTQELRDFLEQRSASSQQDRALIAQGIHVESWFVLNDQGILVAISDGGNRVIGANFTRREYFAHVIEGSMADAYVGPAYDSRNTNTFKRSVSILIRASDDQKFVLVASVTAPDTQVKDLIRTTRFMVIVWLLVIACPLLIFAVAFGARGLLRKSR